MPACAEVHKVMQEVTGVSYESSEQQVQHVDSSPTRQKRDSKDIKALLKFLVGRNPFTNADTRLRSISSGRIASDKVNAEDAGNIGEKILEKMVGKNVLQVKFTKESQVTTMKMNTKSGKEKNCCSSGFNSSIPKTHKNCRAQSRIFGRRLCL